ncbi:MAG TPA: chromosome segregation protein [Planctomycetaceae bacterium]|nr:chromosome segregation protein [Planctomycetaceae bacterium]
MNPRHILPLLFLLATPVTSAEDAAAINFPRDIRPILSENCFQCHGPDARARKGELRLDIAGEALGHDPPVLVAGQPDNSVIWKRISSQDPDVRMPPPGSNRQLTDRQRELIRRWIAEGAEFGDHWSLVPPVRRPPPVQTTGLGANVIDAFILDRLKSAGLTMSPMANRRTLLRRLTFDLVGLPPTEQELTMFLADTAPGSWNRAVDRLLNSPRFGEHMAWNWLVASRYADTNGYQGDGTRVMWPWREWVISAFNDNLPFNRFTIDQLAGDLVPGTTPEQLVATGFNRNHPLNGEGGRIAEENRVEYVLDRTDTTATVWMALTLACAKCHDHKFDPLSQKEYYRFSAYFNSLDESGRVDRRGNANPVARVTTRAQQTQLHRIDSLIEQQRAILDRPLDSLAIQRREWLSRIRRQVSDKMLQGWHSLRPTKTRSRAGAQLKPQADHSLLVSGKIAAVDDYEVQTSVPPGPITGFRLEALTHHSLGFQGPGRKSNFVLTHFSVTVHQAGAKPYSLPFADVVADHSEESWNVMGAIDPSPTTGWGVWDGVDETAQNRQAVFRLKKTVNITTNSTLVFRLKQQSRFKEHLLGRFRISVTGVPRPGLATDTIPPAEILELVGKPADTLNADHRKRLAEFHRGTTDQSREAYRRHSIQRAARQRLESGMIESMVMRDRKTPRTTYVLNLARYDQPRDSEKLAHGVPASLPALPKTAPANRLAMARWLVDPGHPLTARVAVNRLWQTFFGTGLVKTSEDFGSQGDPPSHPELLDWLATEYIRTGWDTKRMVRLLVTSSTYRQSSSVTPGQLEADPYNRLLGRGPRHRLPAHVIRDQALAVSGLLVETIGGPSVKPYQPPGLWADFSFGKIRYTADTGAKLYRRSLYTFWRRSLGPPNMFDEGTRDVCHVTPQRTNTPLHALTLLNDVAFAESARVLAERVLATPGDDASRLKRTFSLVLSRPPSPEEMSLVISSLNRARRHYRAHPKDAGAFGTVGSHSPRDGLDPIQVAAFGAVASVLLNSDEAITRE